MDVLPVRRAILSVSDKSGLAPFAAALAAGGVELFSTGGTRRHLEGAGLVVRDIADYTGFPEMMEGRIKTLHPKVHGGLLCRRDHPGDMASAAEHGIVPFDLVAINLYPFEETAARPGATADETIEQIDIGGPSMVRSAAKNHAFTAVVTSPTDYDAVLDELADHGGTTLALRRRLAAAAFARTAAYDRAIAAWFASQSGDDQYFPPDLTLDLSRRDVLRYGENPHQRAAVYAYANRPIEGMVGAEKLHGKELSYNNLLDLDAAWTVVRGMSLAAVAVIKHNNPCGAAEAHSLAEAARLALDGDPVSAFGSVLAFNREVDSAAAEVLAEPGRFIEAIVAPGFEPAAFEILTTRPKWKGNVRLLALGSAKAAAGAQHWEIRRIEGGFLIQAPDRIDDVESEWTVATKSQPTPAQWDDLRFGWSVVRQVKSNAIVVARGRALAGVGAGQMSRVDSVEIALAKAGEKSRGAGLASDAFFPFPDSIEKAAAAGISAIIQPGGSKNDQASIEAADRHGISMVLTGRRHFRH